jgi:peptidoglycan/LPS O-acetylase OafA/YrhL
LSPHTHTQYRPELDGIRALAIIAVVAYHAGVPYFSSGYLGVDFFFVISGYLITGILAQEVVKSGSLDLKNFWARRVRRLMPAALFMLIICIGLYVWFIPPVVGNYWALARSIASSAFFASNFFFYRQNSGYFDESMNQYPLLHTWSLSVEEQYYLLWPLAIWVVAKYQTRQIKNQNIISKLRGLLWTLFVTSLFIYVYYTTLDPKYSFYLLPARAWEFAAGGLLALYLLNKNLQSIVSSKLAWLGSGLATMGVALSLLSINHIEESTLRIQALWAVLPVIGTTMLIAGLTLNRTGVWSRFFSLRPLVWLGLLSYSWYLWHWPLLTIQKIYSLGGDTLVQRLGICLLSLGLAYISYRLVERPIRESKPWLFGTTKGALIAGVFIVLSMLGLAAAVIFNKNFQQSNPNHLALEAAKDDRVDLSTCSVLNTSFPELTVCSINDSQLEASAPIIVLWGDSHADHFTATLLQMYPKHKIHKLMFTGCPPLIDDGLTVFNYNAKCQALNQAALAHINSLGAKNERLFLSARWPMYFGQSSISVAEDMKGYPRDIDMYSSMSTGLTNLFKHLPLDTTIIGATPELTLNAPKCLMTRPSQACDVPKSTVDAQLNPSFSALKKIMSNHPTMNFIDLRPYFCNESTCFASKNGRSLYTDDDHITATTAKDLAGFFKLQKK